MLLNSEASEDEVKAPTAPDPENAEAEVPEEPDTASSDAAQQDVPAAVSPVAPSPRLPEATASEPAAEPLPATASEAEVAEMTTEQYLARLPYDPRLRTPMMRPAKRPQQATLNNRVRPELSERIRKHKERTGEAAVSVVERALDVMLEVSEVKAGIAISPSPLLAGQPLVRQPENARLAEVLAALPEDPRLEPPVMRPIEPDLMDQFNHRISAHVRKRLDAHIRRTGETIASFLDRTLGLLMDVAEAEHPPE